MSLAAYLVLLLATVARHEMWRDELQTWMVAVQSRSLAQLFANKAYDGHPALWYLAVYSITRFTERPLLMQLFHAGVAAATVSIVLRRAPWPPHQRLLFSLGYYLLYEYAAISRDYALGVLLLVSFCAADRRPLRQAWVLVFLIQTSVHGLLLALALAVVPGRALYGELRRGAGALPIAACATAIAASLAFAALQLLPPADSGLGRGLHFDSSPQGLGKTLTVLWKAFVPVPRAGLHFWNSNFVASKRVQLPLALAVLALTVLLLRRRPLLLGVWCLGLALQLAFAHAKYAGFIRHHGHLYLLFMACWWLAHRAEPGSRVRRGSGGTACERAISVLLAVHVGAGLHAVGMDWRYPFSASEAVAGFLRERGLAEARMAGYVDSPASAVAGHLGRPIHYIGADRPGTFIVYDTRTRQRRPLGEVVEIAERLPVRPGQPTVLVLNRLFDGVEREPLVPLAEFSTSIEASERYWIYLLRR